MERNMTVELEVGMRGYEELLVSEKDLASFAGNVGVDVLSTHRVVLLMELAARKHCLNWRRGSHAEWASVTK